MYMYNAIMIIAKLGKLQRRPISVLFSQSLFNLLSSEGWVIIKDTAVACMVDSEGFKHSLVAT